MLLTDDVYPHVYTVTRTAGVVCYYFIWKAGSRPVYLVNAQWWPSAHTEEGSVQRSYDRVTDVSIRQQVIQSFEANCPPRLTEKHLCY